MGILLDDLAGLVVAGDAADRHADGSHHGGQRADVEGPPALGAGDGHAGVEHGLVSRLQALHLEPTIGLHSDLDHILRGGQRGERHTRGRANTWVYRPVIMETDTRWKKVFRTFFP